MSCHIASMSVDNFDFQRLITRFVWMTAPDVAPQRIPTENLRVSWGERHDFDAMSSHPHRRANRVEQCLQANGRSLVCVLT